MKKHYVLLAIFLLIFVWSAIYPHDYFTWFLEIFPTLIACIILVTTYKKFQLTDIAYCLILVHCIILCIGGKYTYAEVPLFDWIKEHFNQSRNNYDKVGHLAQGFVPAIVIREILIRKNVIKNGTWLNVIIVFFCLGISALYELLEWLVAELSGEGADAFLGTQGFAWDTQSDMLCALIGAVTSLVVLSKWHNRQINSINYK